MNSLWKKNNHRTGPASPKNNHLQKRAASPAKGRTSIRHLYQTQASKSAKSCLRIYTLTKTQKQKKTVRDVSVLHQATRKLLWAS